MSELKDNLKFARMKNSENKCFICQESRETNKKLNLIGLPKILNWLERWLKAIDLDHEIANDYDIKICSNHFSNPDFEEKGRQLSLKFGVVPSLNMKMKNYVYELPRFDAKKFQDYKHARISELSQESNKGCIDKLKKLGLLKPENAPPVQNRVMPPVTMMSSLQTDTEKPDKQEPKTVFKITPYLNGSIKFKNREKKKEVLVQQIKGIPAEPPSRSYDIKEIPVMEVQNPRKKIVMYPPDPLEIPKGAPRPSQPLGMLFESPVHVEEEEEKPCPKSFVSAFTNYHQINEDSAKKISVPDHQNYTQNVNRPVTRSSNVLSLPVAAKPPITAPLPVQSQSLMQVPLSLQSQLPRQQVPLQIQLPDPRECLEVIYNLPNQVQVPILPAPIPSGPPLQMACVQCIVKDKKIDRLEKALGKYKKQCQEHIKKVRNLQRIVRRKDHRMEILKEKLEIFGNLKGKLKINDLNDVEIVYETVNDDGTLEEEVVNLGEKRKAKKLKKKSMKKKKVEDLEASENGQVSEVEMEENQEETEVQFQEVMQNENEEENTLKLECEEEEEDLIVYEQEYSNLEIQVLDETWQA